MSVTPRYLKCETCGQRPSLVRDTTLEKTGVCKPCADQARVKAAINGGSR